VRIDELRLERFGHFSDVTLPLARSSGLTILYGANEAGKSTLLAALRAFLFGFPRGAAWDFRWPSDTLAVGGTLAFADGAIAELRREKKRGLKGKVLGPRPQAGAASGASFDDVALTDELLRARLGRPSAEMFSTVFAFSLEDLARGGEALRDEGLRAAIAGAGLGAARSPQAVIKELRDKAEALFTVKGRAGKLINSTLAEIKEREQEKRKVEARGEDYQARVQARDTARLEAESLGRTRGELLARIGEREALVRALPRRDELRGALAERSSLSPSTLPPDAGDDYQRALEERARLLQRAGELDAKLARTQREAEALALTVDETLLGAAPRIRPLAEGLGRHAEESRQADELGGALRTRRLELGRQLAELKPGWALDDLDVLPHPLFTSGLERLREGWSGHQQRAVELARQLSARRELETRRATLRRRLDPPWPLASDQSDERAFLPVPRAEECKRHRDTLAHKERALAELRRDDERLLEEQRGLESQLSRLDAGGVVPSTEELSRLRAARDAAWSALRRSLSVARTTAADRAALADTFESSLRAADTHADELRRRSDDVAKRAELELRLAEVTRARADRAAALATAERERATAEAAWHALWSRCGFVPQSPETMLEWLGEHAELRKLDLERERVAGEIATLQAAQDDYGRRLGAILDTLGFDARTELPSARRIVDTVLAVRAEVEQLRRDEERARKLGANVAAWRSEVKRLSAEVASPLAALAVQDAAAAMRALAERLTAAEKGRGLRTQLAALEQELAAERDECASHQRSVEESLAAWRRRATVDDDGAFLHAAAAARRGHALDREIAQLQRSLAEARGAMAAGAFDSALETAERSVVEAELAELRAQLPRLDADFRAASERVGAAEATLAQLDGSARAAELGAGVESRRAELRGLVEQYAVVTLSRALLERQVARFQERHQPRMLEELSTLFRALTEGRYARVYPRYDDEGTFVAVRADGVEVTPEAMSTGTREQLWLAVRLAYVRQYCDASEPLPLILDDPLVNFDAARARATLAVLAEFAKKSQVLMLTCHAHLVALAREVAAVEPLDVPLPS
jgi:uncharacterized protein YhaN